MFFLRRTRPLELTAGRMRALRLSLNTPVVATPDLPVGPARAAIALHAEPRQGLSLTVGVRSLGSSSVALYAFDGAITQEDASDVMDAALSFAEGMGFLFDDELEGCDTASREKALVRWNEAIGADPAGLSEPDGAAEPILELFDLAGTDLTDPPVEAPAQAAPGEIDLAPASASAPEASGPDPTSLAFEPAAEAPAALSLTKFRLHADTPEAPGAPQVARAQRAPGKRTLGRVRLTRRRSERPVQDARRSWLLRLLTSF